MKYPISEQYDNPAINARVMGPNPLKLQEELLRDYPVPVGAVVMDLGSGQGVTSAILAKEYGLTVFAADLWSDPGDNMEFFRSMGLTNRQIAPIHADANDLPFARAFFDAVISTDSYNYFGRDPEYLGKRLLPFVAKGGMILIVVPGMKKDCHDSLPPELLLSWTPEQLDYLHDVPYWENIIRQTEGIDVLGIREMESNEEVWSDWIRQDNDYARGDAKAIAAGGGRCLNFVEIALRKKAQ